MAKRRYLPSANRGYETSVYRWASVYHGAKEMPVSVEHLLSKDYAAIRAKEVNDKAIDPKPYELPSGGTVYLATADDEGNMVSFIQSNYMGFGSGIVIPGTGISLQNRGQILH